MGAGTESGLEENVAGALCYVLGLVSGLVFFMVEGKNRFIRFHAVQSIIVFGGLCVVGFVLAFMGALFSFIPWVGWVAGLFVGLLGFIFFCGAFVLWVVLMFKAYRGERYMLPVVGEYADKYSKTVK